MAARQPARDRGRRADASSRSAGAAAGPVVERGVVGERGGRDVGQHRTAAPSRMRSRPPVGDGADDRGPHLPAPAHLLDRVAVAGGDDGEHALLALGRHHLEGLHARLAPGDDVDVDVHAHAAARRGLRRRAGEAGAAEVLDPDHQAAVEQLETRLDEPLLLEGVTHLHARPLGVVAVAVLAEGGRGQHAHAADPVAPGGRAEQHGQVPLAGGRPEHEALDGQDPEAQHVDERVAGVAGGEGELAADGGHAHRVAVAGDAGHHALGQPPGAGVVEGAEEQRVHEGDGPGPHGEDVAQDAAHTGGGALVGLDGRRVVVALDPQRHGDAVAGVDDPGVLARPDEDVGRLGRAGA